MPIIFSLAGSLSPYIKNLVFLLTERTSPNPLVSWQALPECVSLILVLLLIATPLQQLGRKQVNRDAHWSYFSYFRSSTNIFIQSFICCQYFTKMTIKESLPESKGKIIIAALGIAAAGALTYWLVRKFKNPQAPTPIPYPNQVANNSSVSSNNTDNNSQQETYDQKFARVINETRALLDASRNQITPSVISAIIRGQYELANEDIKALILKSRKERRNKLEDALEYAKIVTKYQLDLQGLQEKHLGSILARFNIDKAEWKEACNIWEAKNEDGDEGLSALIRQEEAKQLLSLRIPNTKAKPYLFVEEILKFRIKTLEVINPTELGVDLAADDAAKYDLIETYVNDLVFKKFNIQQEDIEFSIEQFGESDKGKIIKLQDEIGFLMEKFIGEDDEEQRESNFY